MHICSVYPKNSNIRRIGKPTVTTIRLKFTFPNVRKSFATTQVRLSKVATRTVAVRTSFEKTTPIKAVDPQGLDSKENCPGCGIILATRASNRSCIVCPTRKTPMLCIFCAFTIRGLASPGDHVLYVSCHAKSQSLSVVSNKFDGSMKLLLRQRLRLYM